MSMSKFAWMFVDPNGGMLFYTPGLLLMLLAATVVSGMRARREGTVWEIGLLGCTLFTLLASTCQWNWNHPTLGVSRYVLYAVGPMLLYIGVWLSQASLSTARVAIVVIAVALQLAANLEYGFFQYRGTDFMHQSPAAQYVLGHWPALYSPPHEIFCERVLHRCGTDRRSGEVLAKQLPVVWRDHDGRARKILAADCDPERVLRAAQWTPVEATAIRDAMRNCHASGPTYVNL
jgi:hypothetical protein